MDALTLTKSYVYEMLSWTLQLYSWTVIIYILAGWFISNRGAAWYVFMEELVEPALAKIRKITGNRLVIERIDLSPLLLFFGIRLAQWLLFEIFF